MEEYDLKPNQDVPTDDELDAELAALEAEHGEGAGEDDDPPGDEPEDSEDEDEGEDEDGDEEDSDEEESGEAPDLGEFTQAEHDKALKALRRAGFDESDWKGWTARQVAAKGLKLARQQAEQDTTWAKLQELERGTDSNDSESRSEEGDGSPLPRSQPEPVNLDAVRSSLAEKIGADDAEAVLEAAQAVSAPLQAENALLQRQLRSLSASVFAREEAEAFDGLRGSFKDARGNDLLDDADVRARVLKEAAHQRRAHPDASLTESIRSAARLELYDQAVSSSEAKGKSKAERSARKRRGATSMQSLRSTRSESMTPEQQLDAALRDAEKANNW